MRNRDAQRAHARLRESRGSRPICAHPQAAGRGIARAARAVMRTVRLLFPSLLVVAACTGDPGDDPPAAPDAQGAGATAATAPAAPGAVLGPLGGPFQPGELIVKTTTPIDGTSVVTIAGQRLRPLREKPSGAWLVELDDPHRRAAGTTALEHATLDALTALTADPTVEYAHENPLVELSFTPNDPLFSQQWQWTPSRVPDAWDRTVGPAPGAQPVRIAIIDTGNRSHPDLDGRWDPGYDFVDWDDDPTQPVVPYVPGVSADWPHGTHVAGIAGARGNDWNGVAGVCWNCRLIALRIADFDDVEAAITWVANNGSRRAEVINMSLNLNSVTSCDAMPDVRDAINAAAAAGVAVVASAGNRSFTNGARFPASCANVIGVAASDRNNTIAQYSNRGPFTDFTVPAGAGVSETTNGGMYGAGIGCPADPNPNDPYSGNNGALSTWMVGNASCYRHLSGTSMAAPHVSGIVGLMRTVNGSLTPAQIEQYLIATADASILNCPGGGCGAGIVNARAAVDAALFGLGPEITVSPTAIAFGNQQVGTSAAPRNVIITNTGAGTLTFNIAGTSAAFPVNCNGSCSGSLTSGQSRTFTVGFAPGSQGSWSSSINVTSNDADEPSTIITLSGNAITPIIGVTPTSVAFGNVVVGSTSAAQNVTVSNAAAATMALTFSVSSSSAEFPINCNGPCSGTLAPGQNRVISVSFGPSAAGPRSGTLVFTHNDLTRGPIIVPLSGTGVVPPTVTVSPPSLSFGSTPVVSPRTMNLSVTNSGGMPLTYSVTLSGNRFFLLCNPCSGTLAPSATAVIPVQFAPQNIGAHTGTLTVTSNDPARPVVSVPLSGTGTAPIAEVTPPSLAFGDVAVAGGTATQPLTIRNVGNAGLHGSVSLVGPNASDFTMTCQSPCSFLAPGEARVYNVTFDPSAIGARTATISVSTDDPYRPVINVPLSGNGLAPGIEVTPSSIWFGTQLVGTPSTQDVAVRNTGTAPLVLTTVTAPTGFSVGGATLPVTIAPGAVRNLAVTCQRTSVGWYGGNLTLSSNAGAASVALSCSSVAARLVYDEPVNGDLWLVPGQSATVTARNAGPGMLYIAYVGFSGEPDSWFFADTPPLPVVLAPGETLSWTVTCSPPSIWGSTTEKHYVKHDGLDPGSIGAHCNAGPWDEIPIPVDPVPVPEES